MGVESRVSLEEAVARAPEQFQPALRWFDERRGTDIPWPSPSPVGEMPHVVSIPKGIYRPKGFEFVLTVRQTLSSPYADKAPRHRSDGTWRYDYFQEGEDPADRDSFPTNLGMMRNLEDGIPVAVLVQTVKSPSVRYRVEGLAMVRSWDGGFFRLEGFASKRTARSS